MPEAECFGQQRGALIPCAGPDGVGRLGAEPGELAQVQFAGTDVDQVAGCLGDDPAAIRAEEPTKPFDVSLNGVTCARRSVVVPDRHGQRGDWHDLSRVQQQGDQDDPLLGWQVVRLRPENGETHRSYPSSRLRAPAARPRHISYLHASDRRR